MTLDELGLNAGRLIAGFSGGVVAAFVLRLRVPSEVVGSVVAGTLTANFLGPAATYYIPTWAQGGTNFIVGLGAMAICQGVIAMIKMRLRKSLDEEGSP